MPYYFKQIPAAKALLRLLDDQQTLEALTESYHSHDFPTEQLESIFRLLYMVDTGRAGQLFPSNPSLKLLTDAYENGVRLRLTKTDIPSDDCIDIFLANKNIVTVTVTSCGEYCTIENLWKEIHRATYNVPRPTYTTQEIAATIINKFSQKLQECRSQTFVQRRNIIARFIVSREFNLKSIDLTNFQKLLTQLQTSLASVHGDEIKLIVVANRMYYASQTFYKTPQETCQRNLGKTVLQLGLQAPTHERLLAINLQAWLAALQQHRWDFTLTGTFKTKTEGFSITASSGYIYEADREKAERYKQDQIDLGQPLLQVDDQDSVETRVLSTIPYF